MRAAVTLHIDAPPEKVWGLVSDITKMGEYSPEVFEAEWLGGATGPAVGARYRGHVKRNERGPALLDHVRGHRVRARRGLRVRRRDAATGPSTPGATSSPATDGGTDVTESFDLGDNLFTKLWRPLGGFLCASAATGATCSAPSSG